jgi:hypothetical protein
MRVGSNRSPISKIATPTATEASTTTICPIAFRKNVPKNDRIPLRLFKSPVQFGTAFERASIGPTAPRRPASSAGEREAAFGKPNLVRSSVSSGQGSHGVQQG